MSLKYIDAHCHLHDPRLEPFLERILEECDANCVARLVVNGTRPEDWKAVATLYAHHPDRIIPCFGLHPWYVKQAGHHWLDGLEDLLAEHPKAGVGEIGLDRANSEVTGPISEQTRIFEAQLKLAERMSRPVMVHCVKAWGQLCDSIERFPQLATSGILLHSFGGSPEVSERLAASGGYFSISGSATHRRNKRQIKAIKSIPPDRLLAESDAPEMLPTPEFRSGTVFLDAEDTPLNTPGQLPGILRFLAREREVSEAALTEQVYQNSCWFLKL